MARRYYSSTAARTTLASGVDDSTTTLSVVAVSGWPASYPYTLILDQDTVNEEIVEVSARSGTTLTVTRGVDGTSATAHDAGAAVNHGVSARDFDEPNEFINGTGVVTETLLASDSVTSAKIVDGTIVNADINASAAIAQSKIADLTSDLASKLAYSYGTAEPTTTIDGFVWFDENTTPPTPKYWDGSAFQTFSAGAADFSNSATGTYTDTGVDYKYITFTASGTLTVTKAGFADVLVVGGGGAGGFGNFDGGGNIQSSGGGAGGFVELQNAYLPAGTETIVIGAGGTGSATDVNVAARGNHSSFSKWLAVGGGMGVIYPKGNTAVTPGQSIDGGSGGGGSGGTAGIGITGQGNNGGTGVGGYNQSAGGGGGAGAVGVNSSGTTGGAGGSGSSSSITGSAVTYSGGGGGAGNSTGGSGGSGGGGTGATGAGNGTAGTANTGGGGGGAGTGTSGSGGSGVVIVRVKV